MNELKSLEILREQIESNNKNADWSELRTAYLTVKKALKRLENIEQPISIRALNAISRIRQELRYTKCNPDFDKDYCCDIIEEALKEFDILKMEGK